MIEALAIFLIGFITGRLARTRRQRSIDRHREEMRDRFARMGFEYYD